MLFVVLDDTGFARLGCYGSPISTPNIDRLAANGIRYNNMHTTALCSPTRTCILTGRNHHSNAMACITEASTGFPGANAAAIVLNRSHAIVADVDIPDDGAEGMIVVHRGSDGGYGLYVKDRKLTWVHNYVTREYFT